MSKIREAGGIVVKQDASTVRYLLVTAKNNSDQWIFPKGHIETGEGGEKAAVREVKEEAGVETQVWSRIQELEFKYEGQIICVEFYLLKYLGETESGERREKRWCPYDEALNVLTFADTREILRAAHAVVEKDLKDTKMMLPHKLFNKWQTLFAWFGGDSQSLKRLSEALPISEMRLNLRIARNRSTPPWAITSRECLQNANSAFDRYAADKGWACLLEAEKVEVEGYTRAELIALLISLRKETQEKLKDWRQQSTKELLTTKPAETTHGKETELRGDDSEGKAGSEAPSNAEITRVQEALRLRNEHFHNQYTRIKIRRLQLLVAGLFVAAALLTTLVVTVWGAPLLGDNSGMLRLAALFGLLGGALSTAISLARSAYHRIPEYLDAWSVTLIRPVLGSAAAVAAFAFLKAGKVSFGGPNDDWVVLCVSFLAGFSEQWFLRVVGGSGQKSE